METTCEKLKTKNYLPEATIILESHFEDLKQGVKVLASRSRRYSERIDQVIINFQPYESSGMYGVFPVLLPKGVGEIFGSHIYERKRAKVTFIPKVSIYLTSDNCQNAYRAGRSMETVLYQLTEVI